LFVRWLSASCGVVLGVIVSAGAGGLIRNALTGPASTPASNLLVAPAVLATVMIAAYIPARRAATFDPLVALRQD
jgi:ABC-type antimicrobial peptide transport system permease subunit